MELGESGLEATGEDFLADTLDGDAEPFLDQVGEKL